MLHYECGGILVREWYEADRKGMRRHLAVGPGEEMLFLLGEGEFEAVVSGSATSAKLGLAANHAGMKLEVREGKLIGRLAASKQGTARDPELRDREGGRLRQDTRGAG